MAVSNPTYITKSKHGVYYFQLLVSKAISDKVGIQSSRYTRSLKTKDKRVALAKAKKIQSRFHFIVMNNGKDKVKNQLDALFEEDEHSIGLADIARQDELIHTAYFVDKRYEQIEPKTDVAYSMFFDALTLYEQEAMQFVADNGIVLADYGNSSSSQVVYVAKSEIADLRQIGFDELAEKYLKHCKLNDVGARSLIMYRDQIQMFRDIIQVSKPSELDEDALDRYVDGLSKFPANRNKGVFKNKTVNEILDMNLTEGILAKSSMKGYSTNVKAFVEWAIRSKYCREGISIALKGVFKNATNDSYKPFADDEIVSLFLSEPFIKGTIRKPSSYWITIIGLFTGARQNEICQLAISDIKTEKVGGDRIYCFDFNDEDYKSQKNKSSKRKVPIHPELIKLGFIEFVERQRVKGKSRIFHDLKMDSKGKFNDPYQKWFRRHRIKCGVESKEGAKKVFHSFRHTLITQLRNHPSGIPIENIREVVGHANKSTILTVYAPELSMAKKWEIVLKIKFDIDFGEIRRWTIT